MTVPSIQDFADEVGMRIAARGQRWDPAQCRRVAQGIHDRLPTAGGAGLWRVPTHPTQPLDPSAFPGPHYEVIRKGSAPVYWSEHRAWSQVVADALNALSRS
jgi:hypothetical protein